MADRVLRSRAVLVGEDMPADEIQAEIPRGREVLRFSGIGKHRTRRAQRLNGKALRDSATATGSPGEDSLGEQRLE
ncbi:hypothetical protein L6452_05995 [Arctium lappa]|uniref:Uncharacterized protein n=1 Tax=Arctium lappa TaxID=4217 RepID=A0ACB9EIM6_ARCLA|nr:hypothetical protein L6452_05995 [Arctium lappa]